MFPEERSESLQQAFNTDFTFELFICAAILLENRESLLQCQDDVQLIQFTSRCDTVHYDMFENVCLCSTLKNVPLCSLQGKLDLNRILEKAESHFYNYCKRCAWGYMNGHCRTNSSKHEDFFYQLRSLFVLK